MKMGLFLRRAGFGMTTALCLFAASVSDGADGGGYALKLDEGSKLWLAGDSTLHAYESTATELLLESDVVMGQGAIPSAIFSGTEEAGRVASLRLTVPVKGLKSGVVGLSGPMHKALKHKAHPNIIFVMKSYAVAKDAKQPDVFTITAEGDLTLAGVTNRISITMTGLLEGDYANVTGERDLLMTDFGVEPPTMMFGAIKTDDKVVVKWDLKVTIAPSERSADSID